MVLCIYTLVSYSTTFRFLRALSKLAGFFSHSLFLFFLTRPPSLLPHSASFSSSSLGLLLFFYTRPPSLLPLHPPQPPQPYPPQSHHPPLSLFSALLDPPPPSIPLVLSSHLFSTVALDISHELHIYYVYVSVCGYAYACFAYSSNAFSVFSRIIINIYILCCHFVFQPHCIRKSYAVSTHTGCGRCPRYLSSYHSINYFY